MATTIVFAIEDHRASSREESSRRTLTTNIAIPSLGRALRKLLGEVREFVVEWILGGESHLDARGELPSSIYRAFRQAELANWWLPRRYGGRGASLEESVDVVAELAYGDAGLAFAFFLPILGSTAIELYASDDQRDRYLGLMGSEGAACATAASERAAGSELTRLSTTATEVDGTYRLSGDKFFSTNAEIAEFLVVYARSERSASSFGAFIIPKKTPGLEIVRRWDTLGVRSAGTYELALRDCVAEPPLEGNGLRILEVGLNASRTLMAASAVGIGRRVRDLCLEYAANKELKGDKLIESDVFCAKLGQIEAELDTMLAVCKTAAREFDSIRSERDAPERFLRAGALKSVLVAKMMCGQLGWRIASLGSEMLGGLGYTEDSLIGKLVRDVRYVSIVEAGDDVLRDLLFSRFVLPGFQSGGP